jgi:type I site-specific restriction endonuclease
MAFYDPARAYERLLAAEERREPLTLTADEVADLIAQVPDADDYVSYDDVRARLAKVDAKALKMSVKARQALAEAFGYDVEDIWT